MEKHREMANAKSDKDKKLLITLLDTIQNQMLQIKRYNSLSTFPSNTSHNITTLVSKIRKIHKNLNPEKLDITIFENQLDESKSSILSCVLDSVLNRGLK